MSVYFDALRAAMLMIAEEPRSIFMGQAMTEGTAMAKTFRGIAPEKLLELPVMEDAQLGMATGMSLTGLIPVTCYPRVNFLLLAMSQLVLHLDALPRYSTWRPRVIVRTAIATPVPLDPGPQHLGDFTEAFCSMLQTVEVVRLDSADRIVPEYGKALQREGSTLLIERTELYA
jgi:pyruvate/2-oxoglutarate/acetoin dehydrogenase E1 component